jgi:hypothetical protein
LQGIFIHRLKYRQKIFLNNYLYPQKHKIKSLQWGKCQACRRFDAYGKPNIIYSITVIYAVYSYHLDSIREAAFILSSAIVVFTIKPIENIYFAINQAYVILKLKSSTICQQIGTIVSYQSPKIVHIRQSNNSHISNGSVIILNDPNIGVKLALTIGYSGQSNGKILRVLEIDMPQNIKSKVQLLAKQIPDFQASILPSNFLQEISNHINYINRFRYFVGIVDINTNIERLTFEVINEVDLEVGKLVVTSVQNSHVLYQIIEGITAEEVIQNKNKYGFARASAIKIGIWKEYEQKFITNKWIPNINDPVFLDVGVIGIPNRNRIGHFPGSNYPAEIKDIHELVTHNTAILGILGVGKSYLAAELAERAIKENIKVVVLDLTNQYSELLKNFYNKSNEEHKIKNIREVGETDQDTIAPKHQDGGSYSKFRQVICDDLKSFILNGTDDNLKIYNPAELTATKQKHDPKNIQINGSWQTLAEIQKISPVEITQIIAESILSLLKNEMSQKARVCLILEEAHSLVPEWNSVVEDRDKYATAGTARAIMQGRKYGFGCILVTQRTANVTKSILNQCNTIFAMRTFDDTGKTFLSNYIGEYYTNILSSIPPRYAIFFGRASKCENPILIELNDRNNSINEQSKNS